MRRIPSILLFLCGLLTAFTLRAQIRSYTASSVLSAGKWYKLAVKDAGMYKIDASYLTRLGITLPVPSSQLRLFGNGGYMLPEANAALRPDDLSENALLVEDGGDGSFGAQDYFLFYAPGAHQRIWDTATACYRQVRNYYTDSSWYFLTVGGGGKRMTRAQTVTPVQTVNSFDDLYVHETDEVNLLQSGKEWYGETFGSGLGRPSSREFNIPLKQIISGSPLLLYTDVLARSIGQSSRFDIRLNGQSVQQLIVPALSGSAYDPAGTPASLLSSLPAPAAELTVSMLFTPGNSAAQGWLNRFELNLRRRLDMTQVSQLAFRDRASAAVSGIRFSITNAPAGTRVLDVTNFLNPVEYAVVNSGSTAFFDAPGGQVREYIAFQPNQLPAPSPGVVISNQNLHGQSSAAYLIISHGSLLAQARRLGDYHLRQQGLSYLVADVQQIYHEFASGAPDPTAIRDFVKMFYDRAGNDASKRPRYLLLFGDASYDYRNRISGNTNLVPAYASDASLDMLVSHTSDDYFGFLDDDEDIRSLTARNLLDIGIGRVPAATPEDARTYVDKVISYPNSFGPWRNQFTLVADDEDQNLHLRDAEEMARIVEGTNPQLRLQKIYLDAFPQESGAGGARYPEVNEAINRRMFNGNLIWNYSGHGGYKRLAEEAVLEENMLDGWQNASRLPLFITATCDFAPYDNPQINSLGEQLLLRKNGGAIALMTTTRIVFAYANRILNANYLNTVTARQADGSWLSLGDAVRQSKNNTYNSLSDAINIRKFTLLGDPALVLGFPMHQVVTTAINDSAASRFTDTLRALNRYTFSGEVRNRQGNRLAGFNGTLTATLYDKAQIRTTRRNDPGSLQESFAQQQQVLFNGKADVKDGRFQYSFVVPKDIDLRTGAIRLSYYADDGNTDAAGLETNWYAGGLGTEGNDDRKGPLIKAYLNDERFLNGGIVNNQPLLLVDLYDSSGLNTVGTGIGHDMIAVLDENHTRVFVLNDYFEAETNSYQKGRIRFLLPVLEEGLHQLKIRAWDVFNNPSEVLLTFRVVKDAPALLLQVKTIPNPFTSKTKFSFEHNRVGEPLQVSVHLFTHNGQWIKTLRKTIIATGNRSDEVEWDGTDERGRRLHGGVYIYKLTVQGADGLLRHNAGKLLMQ